ncbi:MAG: RluA family pseudouridine synthase [Kofleriaceae bacterium]
MTSPTPSEADEDPESEPEPDLAIDAFTLPPGADPAIDWGLTSHLHADGTPKIIERHLVVPAELAGLRLDHFIKNQITRLSRTRIQQIITTQISRVAPASNSALKPATIVAENEHYVIRRPARREPPCPRTLTVVHADARCYVIDKPAYLPVHASAKFYFNTLTRVLDERFPDEPALQICHRLDRETSGCLVVARDRAAASALKQAFATKTKIEKEYLAVVHGQPPWDETHTLDILLRLAQPGDATKLTHVRMLTGAAAAAAPGSVQAITRVRVEQRTLAPNAGPGSSSSSAGSSGSSGYSLVRCTLVTGRQHQIRAHLAHAGFPIVGDKLYAHGDVAFMRFCDEGLVPDLAALFVLPRQALHAARVAFPHPDGGTVIATAPLPPDMLSLLANPTP